MAGLEDGKAVGSCESGANTVTGPGRVGSETRDPTGQNGRVQAGWWLWHADRLRHVMTGHAEPGTLAWAATGTTAALWQLLAAHAHAVHGTADQAEDTAHRAAQTLRDVLGFLQDLKDTDVLGGYKPPERY